MQEITNNENRQMMHGGVQINSNSPEILTNNNKYYRCYFIVKIYIQQHKNL